MLCSLYQYDLQPTKSSYDEAQRTMNRKERQKEVQAEYYKRRGFFNAYKRKVAKKAGVDLKELASIKTIDDLEAYCSIKIKEKDGVTITNKATAYFLRIC